jgi:PAS domain S-box-containing protein
VKERPIAIQLATLVLAAVLPIALLAVVLAWLAVSWGESAGADVRLVGAGAGAALIIAIGLAVLAARPIIRHIRSGDQAQADLHRATSLFQAVIDMTPDLVFVKDLESRALLRNPAALFGKSWDDVKGRPESEWHEHPEEVAQVVANDRKVIESGRSMQFEERFTTPQGLRTILSTKSPLFDQAGNIVGTIGVCTDVTERENRARHVEFIMRELSHRSKNLLMIIQAVARQSIQQSTSLEAFEKQFNERLASLGRLHDLLVQEEWRGAPLRAIAQTQAGPFAGGRAHIDGPEILFKPDIAQIISMVFHELATNASKYGALSSPAGRILLTWGFVGDQRNRLFIRWEEVDGPPVLPSQRKGFGTVVLERMAIQIPGASASLKFPADGVVWYLEAPLDSFVTGPPWIGH